MDIWQYLGVQGRPIFLYGMGNGAELVINELKKYKITPAGYFASDDFVRGQSFNGKRVLKFSEAYINYPDMIALISFGTGRYEVIKNILSLPCEKYAPELPVVGNVVFNEGFYNNNIGKINEAETLLFDPESKRVYRELIEFKLDGKLEHLLNTQCNEKEYINILNLNGENYLDLGAYNGDTVIKYAPYCKKITALEPDIKNFNKLIKNTEDINPICINSAVGEKCCKTEFSFKNGRNSKIGEGTLIDCISIDSLNDNFTFIKFDVEGAECEALSGGRILLKNRKPKLLVSAYHRSEDIFEIPLLVKSINPDYKISLRRPPHIPAWDVMYLCY